MSPYEMNFIFSPITEFILEALFNQAKKVLFKKDKEIVNDILRNPQIELSEKANIFIEKALNLDTKLIIELSKIKYESQVSMGNLLFVDSNEFEGIKFKNGIAFVENEIRGIRKLIEVTKKNYGLVINDKEILGLGLLDYTKIKYKITFEGFMKWTLYIDNSIAIRYSEGNMLYGETDDQSKILKNKMENTFESSESVEIVLSIYKSALKQKHGTLLIFNENADAESRRLEMANRGIMIQSQVIYEDALIQNLSSIDGALMFDNKGMCYGIGYILDGIALVKGKKERGARFNSAYNYVANQKNSGHNCVAVIISEDKTVDIISTKDEDFDYIM